MRDAATQRPTVLIADDEVVLAQYLKQQVEALWPECRVVGLAHNGVDALRLIDEESPAVAFLDIRMPGMSGLDVAARLQGEAHAPKIVFVTAYDQHAVDAFEREAVDYLLKPPSAERLTRCIDKLKRQLSTPAPTPSSATPDDLLSRLQAVLSATPTSTRLEWIRAAHGNDTRLISVDEVVYFEANDKYVSVFTQDGESLIRTPLKELLDSLDPARFWQIHRGTIVAVRQIASTTRDFRGRTLVRLKHRPEELVVSRAYLHLFRQM
ncbi:MAG: response regulator transcription factor [Burkholderiales bacterium]|nr:response regulator transcription factor [Burkholderiales bacterium]